VGNAVTGSDLVLTLSNGQAITIAVGQTTGFVDVPVRTGAGVLFVTVTGTAGGNYEALAATGAGVTVVPAETLTPPSTPPVPQPPASDPPSSPLPTLAGPQAPVPDPGPSAGPTGRPVDPALQAQPVNLTGGLGGNPPAPALAQAVASGGEVSGDGVGSVVNALPPTAAGTAGDSPLTAPTDQSFQVALVTPADIPGRSGELGSLSGSRLFVLEGVTDIQADKQFQLSSDAFAHTDPNAVIKLDARLSSGEPLPAWLSFNPANGTFSGVPPDGKATPVEVQVVARDSQAREASVIFKLEMGVVGAMTTASGAALDSSDRGFPVSRVGVDAVAPASGLINEANSSTGDRLFVLEGVKSAVGEQRFQLPSEAFAHTDAKAVVKLEARQANGDALPAWMEFDSVTGLFRGAPPDGKPVSLDVIVTARDNQAREASVVFTLEMGVKGADAPAESPVRDTGSGGMTKPDAGAPTERSGAQGTQPGQPGAGLGNDQAAETLKLAQGIPPGGLAGVAAADRGFPVARVGSDTLQPVSEAGGRAVSEARLFVFQGVLAAEGESTYRVPTDAFGHTDPSAIVRLEAHSADGGPLPPWLQFDALSGTFRGTPPGGVRTALEIVLIARDEEGREATIAFTLELGVKVADAAPAKADAERVFEPKAWSDADDAGEEQVADAPGSEAGDAPARDKLEKAKPVRAGAAPFADQVRAAKAARDPLLAKILGGNDKQAAKPAARPRV
jgi:hypothetical protein